MRQSKWCRSFISNTPTRFVAVVPNLLTSGILTKLSKIKGQYTTSGERLTREGQVLDILMQRRRNEAAADKSFPQTAQACWLFPRVITDKLKSYGAAKKSKGSNTDSIRD